MGTLTNGDAPTPVRVGFMPLVDCAVPVVAATCGFAAEEGLALELVQLTSWASVRDKLVFGHLDAAHMLAGMPLAASLGIGHLQVPLVAPIALGKGGNAITVSNSLWQALERTGLLTEGRDPVARGRALARVIADRAEAALRPLTFAMVYPFSSHNYELRYWLGAAGIHPDRDMRLVVIPPPFIPDALKNGQIDGFCVGEPYSSLAVEAGVGRILLTKADLWAQGPEKVLGLREKWVAENPTLTTALIRALAGAAAWAGRPENKGELAAILSETAHVGAPQPVIERALSGHLVLSPGAAPEALPGFLSFAGAGDGVPHRAQALWLYAQMVRWGQVPFSQAGLDVAAGTYRPDLYFRALGPEGPGGSGEPLAGEGIFDGRMFAYGDVEAYLASFSVSGPGNEAHAPSANGADH